MTVVSYILIGRCTVCQNTYYLMFWIMPVQNTILFLFGWALNGLFQNMYFSRLLISSERSHLFLENHLAGFVNTGTTEQGYDWGANECHRHKIFRGSRGMLPREILKKGTSKYAIIFCI